MARWWWCTSVGWLRSLGWAGLEGVSSPCAPQVGVGARVKGRVVVVMVVVVVVVVVEGCPRPVLPFACSQPRAVGPCPQPYSHAPHHRHQHPRTTHPETSMRTPRAPHADTGKVGGKLLGIVTTRDWDFVADLHTPLGEVMTKDVEAAEYGEPGGAACVVVCVVCV